jgi:hypothetical protein
MRPLRLTDTAAPSGLGSIAAVGVFVALSVTAILSTLFLLFNWIGAAIVGVAVRDAVKIPLTGSRAVVRALALNLARFANVSADGGRPRFLLFVCYNEVFGFALLILPSRNLVGGRPGPRFMALSLPIVPFVVAFQLVGAVLLRSGKCVNPWWPTTGSLHGICDGCFFC